MSRQPPVARVGEYHVLDFVGAGGMGEVFRAVHARTGQVAAVKFLTGGADLPPQARARWRERFAHEARVPESLRHPNLAAFYEWHEVGATPCIVMELVDGQTLNSWLHNGALPLPQALAIFRGAVEAVAFMHARGVVHRDIKTSNIKINARGEVKLLDFGIAKTSDMAKLTATGAFVGTLQYLSPEQVKGKEANTRCDVWALGAMFYEMLCGQPPFEAQTWGELLEKVARAQYEPLSVRRSDLPRGVDAIVRRCLQKQPQARFQDAAQLLAALGELDENGVPRSAAKKTSPQNALPFYVAGGAGAAFLAAFVAWSSLTPTVAVVPTRAPLPTSLPAPTLAPDGRTAKTVTINTFQDADKTQIVCNGENLGMAPRQVQAHLGDTLHIELSRPGFQTRRESITVTGSSSAFTFSLEPNPD